MKMAKVMLECDLCENGRYYIEKYLMDFKSSQIYYSLLLCYQLLIMNIAKKKNFWNVHVQMEH